MGGIFYDDLNTGGPDGDSWEADFAFTQEVGRHFLPAFVPVMPKAEIAIWGRNAARASALVARLQGATVAPDLERACRSADVILTATPAAEPLIQADWIRPGCHITAIGADSPGKQELETALVARADLRVADNIAQSLDHGEWLNAQSHRDRGIRHPKTDRSIDGVKAQVGLV